MAPLRWRLVAAGGALAAAVLLGAGSCAGPPSPPDTLPPTLGFEQTAAGRIALQDGIAVPSFAPQPRDHVDLVSGWRFDPGGWNDSLDFLPRTPAIVQQLARESGGRERADFDDRSWPPIAVPGSFNPPPAGGATGGWYRAAFDVPLDWLIYSPTLKFGAVNYLADVWLNGHYLGYHEGGQTPFAFAVASALVLGGRNVLAVHAADPPSGTRGDIVPWGLIDWWRYGGITQPVSMEATPPVNVARADVRPHLDAAQVSLVVENREGRSADATVTLDVLPARTTRANLLDLGAGGLVPPDSRPLVTTQVRVSLAAHSAARVERTFDFGSPDLWAPGTPALYVLDAHLASASEPADELTEAFGLRQVATDPTASSVLVNGSPIFFHGVAVHDEVLSAGDQRYPVGAPITTPEQQLAQLDRALAVHADLIRADHTPANPLLLTMADRLGIAVWEEIPLYHFRPPQLQSTFRRGIPQQMLAEMDLRDFDHPSVLFHGLANESSGDQERKSALDELYALDHRVDGTRLVGQASYGSPPGDGTSRDLDVAGYTYYYGVFYGGEDIAGATGQALDRAHAVLPSKPILVLEFGHWADTLEEEVEQTRVAEDTLRAVDDRADFPGPGFVAGAVWWSLDDYWSDLPGIAVEHFGLFRPDGTPRPAAAHVAALYGSASPPRLIESHGHARVAASPAPRRLLSLAGYSVIVAIALLGAALLAVLRLPQAARA